MHERKSRECAQMQEEDHANAPLMPTTSCNNNHKSHEADAIISGATHSLSSHNATPRGVAFVDLHEGDEDNEDDTGCDGGSTNATTGRRESNCAPRSSGSNFGESAAGAVETGAMPERGCRTANAAHWPTQSGTRHLVDFDSALREQGAIGSSMRKHERLRHSSDAYGHMREAPASGTSQADNLRSNSLQFDAQMSQLRPVMKASGHLSSSPRIIPEGYSKPGKRKRKPKCADVIWNTLEDLCSFIPVENPSSKRRKCWDFMVLLLVLYVLLVVPMQIGFRFGEATTRNLGRFETAVDVFFGVDVVYNFFTAYVDNQLNIVTDRSQIARHYLKTWFTVDLLSTIPFDSIARALSQTSVTELTVFNVLKTPKLLRLSRMMRFIEHLQNVNAFRMVRIVALLMIFTHWIGCIYNFIGLVQPGTTWRDVAREPVRSELTDFTVAYWHSYYKAMLIFMGEDTSPYTLTEIIFTALAMVAGACFYATLAGILSLVVAEYNISATVHRERLKQAHDSLRYLGASHTLIGKVQMYYEYLANFMHPGKGGFETLKNLPEPLFKDIVWKAYGKYIKQVPLFQYAERDLLREVAKTVELVMVLPGQELFRCNSVGNGLYIVTSGSVEVVSEQGHVECVLHEGAYFGEIALLVTSRRTHSVRAVTYTDVAWIDRNQMLELMEEHPRSGRRIWLAAHERLRKLRPENAASKSSATSSDETNRGNNIAPSRSAKTPVSANIDLATVDHAPRAGFREIEKKVVEARQQSETLKSLGFKRPSLHSADKQCRKRSNKQNVKKGVNASEDQNNHMKNASPQEEAESTESQQIRERVYRSHGQSEFYEQEVLQDQQHQHHHEPEPMSVTTQLEQRRPGQQQLAPTTQQSIRLQLDALHQQASTLEHHVDDILTLLQQHQQETSAPG